MVVSSLFSIQQPNGKEVEEKKKPKTPLLKWKNKKKTQGNTKCFTSMELHDYLKKVYLCWLLSGICVCVCEWLRVWQTPSIHQIHFTYKLRTVWMIYACKWYYEWESGDKDKNKSNSFSQTLLTIIIFLFSFIMKCECESVLCRVMTSKNDPKSKKNPVEWLFCHIFVSISNFSESHHHRASLSSLSLLKTIK